MDRREAFGHSTTSMISYYLCWCITTHQSRENRYMFIIPFTLEFLNVTRAVCNKRGIIKTSKSVSSWVFFSTQNSLSQCTSALASEVNILPSSHMYRPISRVGHLGLKTRLPTQAHTWLCITAAYITVHMICDITSLCHFTTFQAIITERAHDWLN